MATTTELLTEARAAYHSLSTGTMARVIVDQNGQRVEFAPANMTKLYTYIQELERLLAGEAGTPAVSRGPARFVF